MGRNPVCPFLRTNEISYHPRGLGILLELLPGKRRPCEASLPPVIFQGHFCYSSAESELLLMESDFATADVAQLDSPGPNHCKASFNYLLLDPRVTRNLPARLNAKSSEAKKLAAFRYVQQKSTLWFTDILSLICRHEILFL